MLVTYLNELKYPVCMRVCVFVCVYGRWREEEWKINWLFLQVLNISTSLPHCCHIPPTFTWESKLWEWVKKIRKRRKEKKRQTSERRKSVIKHKYTINLKKPNNKPTGAKASIENRITLC